MDLLEAEPAVGGECAEASATFPIAKRRKVSLRDLLAAGLLLVCVFLLHGHGLYLGFWFDDHNHLELCQRNGFADLVNGNRFDWNHRIAHAWWAKEETGWAYFRPLTVAIRTLLLQTFGLDPVPFHALHLSLYGLTVVLFYGLLRRFGWSAWSFFAVLFFVLHPANCLTTPWLANDGPVLVGLWTVIAFWLFHASALTEHRRPLLLAGVLTCYALALMSRENGIVLGPLLVLFDLLFRMEGVQATPRRRLAIYLLLALEGIGYLWLRSHCLADAPLPRSPYFHWPQEPGFASWLAYKLLNDLVCLPFGLPFMPIVEVPWWQSHALTTALVVGLLLILANRFFRPLRQSRLAWGVVAGIAIAQLPTMAAFSAAYNYYLATAGWALLLASWAKQLWATRPRLVKATAGLLATCYIFGLWTGSWMIHSAARAERLVRQGVLAADLAECPPGTKLFFINMPFFAMEVGPSLRLALDRPDLEVYPLTLAPQIFFPGTEVTVEKENDHTLLIRSSVPFFSGAFGDKIQLGWYGAKRDDLQLGKVELTPAAGEMPFRVEIVRADIVRLVFEQRLDDPHYRFFVSSPNAPVQALWAGGHKPLSPDEERDFDRLRRMEITTRYCLTMLANWPF